MDIDLTLGSGQIKNDGFNGTDTITGGGSFQFGLSDLADTAVGSDNDDQFEGGGGNDSLVGGAGDNTLQGDEGNDTLRGGNGRHDLRGGDGNDLLDASGGSASTQGFGDFIEPGFGSNTIIGHSGRATTR